MVELEAPRSVFQAADHAWVREHAASSLPEIEKATLRLVALRASRSLSHGAARDGRGLALALDRPPRDANGDRGRRPKTASAAGYARGRGARAAALPSGERGSAGFVT
jgi:hypothetical protein